MYQADRGTYKKETFAELFYHSCLGKRIIMAVIVAFGLLFANLSVPTEDDMIYNTADGISQCINENKLSKNDRIDDVVRNFTAIFTDSDSASIINNLKDFDKYNRLEVYRHTFYSTARVHNNFRPEGTRVAIGIFGIVIPTVSYNDIVMTVGPVRKEYNQKIIETNYDDEYFGTNPDLGNTYNTYQGDGSAE